MFITGESTVGETVKEYMGADLTKEENADACAERFLDTIVRLGPSKLADLTLVVRDMVGVFITDHQERTSMKFSELQPSAQLALMGTYGFILGFIVADFKVKEG